MDKKIYKTYLAILKSELIPALGCTEPIAIAYASAKAREVLGEFPDYMEVECSGNIIKNVKGVTVPGSKGMKGVEAAAILGMLGGDANLQLRVLEKVSDQDINMAKQLLAKKFCKCVFKENVENLYIVAKLYRGNESSEVTIINRHTLITQIVKNGEIIYSYASKESDTDHLTKNSKDMYENEINKIEISKIGGKNKEQNKKENKKTKEMNLADKSGEEKEKEYYPDKSLLNVKNILEFANEVNIDEIQEIMERQIQYNTNIAQEGLFHTYGAEIGKTLLEAYGKDVKTRARAYAAAGSDARMAGCSRPVIINSGSGNQGITVSVPVIEYAKEWKVSREKLYRALVVSNLTAIHQKKYIGNLSAYCGAVSAACGAGAGITYMFGGDEEAVDLTITNTIANVGGIVCDGAKASCAAKIATSVDAAILAHTLAIRGRCFKPGEGIVKQNVEDTIKSVGYIGKVGMKETDTEILNVMLDQAHMEE